MMDSQNQSAETLTQDTQDSSTEVTAPLDISGSPKTAELADPLDISGSPKTDVAAPLDISGSPKTEVTAPLDISGSPKSQSDAASMMEDKDSSGKNSPSVNDESEKEITVKFPVLVLQLDDSGNLQRKQEELEVNIQKLTILISAGIEISQDSFRYAGPCEFTTKATSSVLIVLSYRVSTENNYIFFQSVNEQDAEILEKLKHFRSETLQKFQRSPPVDIWNLLPVQPLFSGKIRVRVLDFENPPEEEKEEEGEEYFVITDVESMSLFKTFPQTIPNHAAFFYQDPGPNVVETVQRINYADINIQTNEKHFVIKEQGPHVEKFVNSLRETKSKPSLFLTRPDSIVDFYRNSMPPPPIKQSRGQSDSRQDSMDVSENDKSDDEEERKPWQATAPSQVADNTADESQLKELQEQMQTALDQFESNEDFQAMWVAAEFELKELEECGAIPETEMESAGLDQNNSNHFCQAFADIEDHLKGERYGTALSRLKACRSIFMYSALHRIRDILREDNFTILKKLFFKCFLY